jgi:hypothetical protein
MATWGRKPEVASDSCDPIRDAASSFQWQRPDLGGQGCSDDGVLDPVAA